MGETLRMSQKEMLRIPVLERLKRGEIGNRHASQMMGLSKRQCQRIKKRFKEGIAEIRHRGRGACSNRKIPDCEIQKVIKIVKEKYADFGPTLAHEKLKAEGGIGFGVEILRQAMIAAGLWKAKQRKERRNHTTRERRACFGELIQIDGSLHKWFEDRGKMCMLLAYIDDATSSVVYAQFVESESTWAYFEATKNYLRAHGKPLALYTDKHSVFRINASKEGQSATSDSQGDTQFSRALKAVDIEIIYAHSPQAKGRVERLYQTLQDRLVKELRLANISDMEAANAFLPKYLADHNWRFAKDPKDPVNMHRPLSADENIEQIFLIQEQRHLSKTLTCQYKNKSYQIHHDKANYTLSQAKITVLEDKEGVVSLYYGNTKLRYSVIETKPLNKDSDSKSLNGIVDKVKAAHSASVKNIKKKASSKPSYRPPVFHPWRSYLQSRVPNTTSNTVAKQLVA